jgi:hypothetical protein
MRVFLASPSCRANAAGAPLDLAGVPTARNCTAHAKPKWHSRGGNSTSINETRSSEATSCCAQCRANSLCDMSTWAGHTGPAGKNSHLKADHTAGAECNSTSSSKTPLVPTPSPPIPTPGPTFPPIRPAPPNSPHILFLFVDEMDGRILDPTNGHPLANTPSTCSSYTHTCCRSIHLLSRGICLPCLHLLQPERFSPHLLSTVLLFSNRRGDTARFAWENGFACPPLSKEESFCIYSPTPPAPHVFSPVLTNPHCTISRCPFLLLSIDGQDGTKK